MNFVYIDPDLQGIMLLGGIWFGLLFFLLWVERKPRVSDSDDYRDDFKPPRTPNGVPHDR